MSTLPSEEVAADFKDCLNDLQMNNRYEISNLTIIAKENIEHAQALSRALEQHIRTTAPSRKLPSLYVLDSIVKNVGSPYTIYLGRNLFSTFMDAYTLVDAKTRKAMESMLGTWKEPVPGSMEPTPVFAPETTRVIENALMKAKAVINRQPVQPRPGSTTFRNTPTPPQQGQRYGPPGQPPQHNGYQSQQSTPVPHQARSTPQPSAQLAQSLLAALGRPPPQDDTARLNADIDNLINTAKTDFAKNPFDTSIQQRLKALLDLQTIMKTQQLPPQALEAIKAQVASLSSARPPSVQPNFPPQPPTSTAWQSPNSNPAPVQPPPNLAQILQRPPSAQPPAPTGPPGFAPGALEALLASTANGQKPSTPQLRQAMPNLANLPIPPPPTNGAAPPPPQAAQAQSLLDALRGAGLATSSHTPNPPAPSIPPPPPPGSQSTASLLATLTSNPLLSHLATPLPPPGFTPSTKPRVPLSQTALRTFRPDLLATLYASQPSQCPTCAHRFPATEAGKSRKAAHLDWHFRTNQRVAESAHRSVHRLWYPDEMEWVRLKEVDSSVLTVEDEAASAEREKAEAAKARQRKWVLAGARGEKNCPICQEGFVAEWSEEAQEWVWNDCVEVGGRVYHEACWGEVSKGLGTGQGVKRKAEEDPLEGLRAKLRIGA
ncbi:hypothetical protein C1H76_1499 [Elsinoe australis]|uniref:CID domain-containing protein n=1 Tax=Elsinoe australis TaxID=40998 RepID=A0A4U7BAW9_9PEZI|nr:hypothetical protein C1H76_1499 [Elsinoe australis]